MYSKTEPQFKTNKTSKTTGNFFLKISIDQKATLNSKISKFDKWKTLDFINHIILYISQLINFSTSIIY